MSGTAGYEPVAPAEHNERIDRARSVPCPHCGEGRGDACKTPSGGYAASTHGARWEAYYLEQAMTEAVRT